MRLSLNEELRKMHTVLITNMNTLMRFDAT